ncbi:MAG: hypothetical protein FWC36_08510 [Spirochaetes bacterium]|nr:hypothetical protein [Spirochaetota bacterium]
MNAKYVVNMPKKIDKVRRDMPQNARTVLAQLIEDLEKSGPEQAAYPNYSKLGKETYHCHLAYKWVACWRCKNGEYIVEVYYVGSREKAPY